MSATGKPYVGGREKASGPEAPITPEQERLFEAKIRPVLVTRCGKCHGSEAGQPKGGLRVDGREGLRLGGDSGPAVGPGDPEGSTPRSSTSSVSTASA